MIEIKYPTFPVKGAHKKMAVQDKYLEKMFKVVKSLNWYPYN